MRGGESSSKIKQLGTREPEFGLCESRFLGSAHHAILLSLPSLPGSIDASGPRAENGRQELCSAHCVAAERGVLQGLDTLGSRVADERHQYAFPRLCVNLAMIISQTHT